VKVYQLTTCDEGITNPKRSTFGVTLALRWGDVLHPLGQDGNWFKPPYFTRIWRFYSIVPLPWITWNLWGHRGYAGCKVFGVDSPAYRLWPAMMGMQHEVYEGSQALMFSARFRISD
jgi:hypothetical protein